MKIYFSNQLEILLDHLKTNLFCANSSFFTKRFLIVPSRKMGSWISLKIAQDLKIAAGYKICSLDFAFSQLTTPALPNELELTFRLLEDLPHEKKLVQYLKGKEQKVTHLASHLAKIFQRYYEYGCLEHKEWQEELWQKYYQEKPFTIPKEEIGLHLFGFSNISPLHFSYFQKAGAFFYQLSPCKEFWSDLQEERQTARFLEKKDDESLEELFSDSNSILANFGRLGRKFCFLIEESGISTQEDYVERQPSCELHQRQQEMLGNQKKQLLEPDDSIQIHFYQTPWQEVEGLYLHLMKLFEKKSLNPSDITVMAPDISLYTPFIQAVFDGKIDYKILDVAKPDSKFLFSLLNLETKRWSVPAVAEVLRASKYWSQEELALISKWIERAQIRWGYDIAHAQDILKRRFPKSRFQDGRGTWKEGLNFLLRGLCEEEFIDFKESELLGQLCQFLQNLFETLKEFHDGTKLTMRQWALKIQNLDQEVDLQRLCEAAPKNTTYSFPLIWPIIKKEICREYTNINSHLLNAITFSSFHTPLPAKVICLLGMNHETIPKKEKYAFLNILKKGPKVSDEDQYTFLETILLAKETLLISYIGRSSFDQTILPPSIVVDELEKKAIEEDLSLPNKKTGPFLSLSKKEPERAPKDCFFELKELQRTIKNPLRTYFEKKLHIKFERNFSTDVDEELKLSPMTLSKWRNDSLKTPLNSLLEKAKKAGGLPVGPFHPVAMKKIQNELKGFQALASNPLVFHSRPIGSYFISGKIEEVTPDGYYTADRYSLKTILCHLPSFLLSEAKTWHFVQEGFSKEFNFSKDLLLRIVDFYANCSFRPTPLFPELIEPLLKKDVKKLKAFLEESFHEEIRYILRRGPLDPDQIIDNWSSDAEILYREVYDAL